MKKSITIIALLAFVFTACSGYLDLDNPNKLPTESFWQTPGDLEAGVATIYNALVEEPAGYWEIQAIQLKEGRTENFTARNDVQGRYFVATYKNSSSTSQISALYKSMYVGIFRANQVIHYAPQVKGISDSLRTQLLAEATFLRGLNYMHLAMEFGSTPIFLDIVTDPSGYFQEKSDASVVWKRAMDDFETASKGLPITYPSNQKGRVTRGAAIAYLGKAYLHQKEWEKAEKQFTILVDNETVYGYGLLDNYADLFDGKHENSIESVFEIQFSREGGPDIWPGAAAQAKRTRATTNAQELAPGEVGGWFEMAPTSVLRDAMLKEKTKTGEFDPRATATLAWNYPGCVYYTYDFKTKFITEKETDPIWLRKNQNWWNKDEGDWKSELNDFPMRYADVLLMLAEAHTMQGAVGKAAPLVQRIRDRAKLTDQLSTMLGWNADQMMVEIMHQRNIEFAREGIHFYDLRRWGTLEKVIKDSKVNGYENFEKKFEYFPIPEQELYNNPKMTQNEGWK